MSNNALNIEFSPHARHWSVRGLVLLLVGILFVSAALLAGVAVMAENASLTDNLEKLTLARQTAPRASPQHADPGNKARIQLVLDTEQRLLAPWPDLLAALESAPDHVALLSIEPSMAKRKVTLTAEAANPTEMLNYLKALQKDGRLSGVVLSSHQVLVQNPGTPVRFQLQAQWGSAL